MILDSIRSARYAKVFSVLYKITNKEDEATVATLLEKNDYPVIEDNYYIIDRGEDVANRTSKFVKDLMFNKPVERNFLDAYHWHNPSDIVTYEFNDDGRFDLKCTYVFEEGDTGYTYVELKNEMSAIKYGNLAIELMCYGKPSGLQSTEANLWVSRVDGFYIVFDTERLKEALEEKSFRNMLSGDNLASHVYLVRIKDIVDYIKYIIVDDTADVWNKIKKI